VRAGATSFQTRAGSFTLVPTVLPELLAWRGPAVMVLARRRGPLTDEQLHTRFGLTQREIVVCRLLATGLTLGAAAAQLRISVHTVRHHTEHAYAKLGVRSRVALSTMLAGSASPPT